MCRGHFRCKARYRATALPRYRATALPRCRWPFDLDVSAFAEPLGLERENRGRLTALARATDRERMRPTDSVSQRSTVPDQICLRGPLARLANTVARSGFCERATERPTSLRCCSNHGLEQQAVLRERIPTHYEAAPDVEVDNHRRLSIFADHDRRGEDDLDPRPARARKCHAR